MSKKCLFIAVVLMTFVFSGCASKNTEPQVPLGKEISLATGQSARVVGENLTITFIEILEDSRCPKNVTCIWAGRVRAAIQLDESGTLNRIELTQPGLTDETTAEYFKDFQLSFIVTPYPEAGKQITAGDYRLRLTVTKR